MQNSLNNSHRSGARARSVRSMALIAGALAFASGLAAPVLASEWEEEFVVVKAGRVITVSGEEFSPGEVVIVDGKISLVGKGLEYPPSSEVIDASRETVMPGFVLARTRYGLPGYSRNGVNGDWNVADELYPDLIDFEDLLRTGFTTACYIPDGGDIPGMACAFKTAGPEEARRLGDAAYLTVQTNWDASGRGKSKLRNALKKAKAEIEKVEKARKEWEEKQKKAKEEAEKKEREEEEKEEEDNGGDDDKRARADEPPKEDEKPDEKKEGEKKEEPAKFEPPKMDPKLLPLVHLIQKKEGASMVVQIDKASDYLHWLDVLESHEDLAHSLFISDNWVTSDFHYVADKLGENEALVALRPFVNQLPYTTFRYNLCADLTAAGAKIAVLPRADSRSHFEDLRTRLAEVVRAGLPREAALKSLTLHPAEQIGQAKRLGSLEKDKDADLVFFNGDPLDPLAQIERVMIGGEIVWKADDK